MSSATRQPNPSGRDSTRLEPTVGQFIGFLLEGEHYAIAIRTIQEIILMKPITRLPRAPESIEGLINLRGTVIPIVSLRKRFGLGARPLDDETRTIVVNSHGKTVGLIVDEVTEVMKIAHDQIQPVPIAVTAASQRCISGLARRDDRLLMILDIDKLLDPNELETGA
ncbi:chemotaxis protein CheW [Singulisphaera sp. PoT]|uniref:chemotaxis protein CheW n=1 Tax=Singulisphaera sp. PoT TaxID=3411797 RepID=UPI003BF56D9B